MLRFSQRVVPMGRAVRRQGRDRQRIAEPGQHRGGDRFDEIRRGVGDHRRAVRLLAFTGWSGTSASDSRARASACQLRSTSS